MSRTVLLIRNAARDDFGGAETYQVSLARCLATHGFEPIIVTRSKKLINFANLNSVKTIRSWWWSRQDWSGIKTIFTPVYGIWQVCLFFWYLSLILKTNASVLHIQSKDDFISASIAGKLLNRTIVWTDHMDLRYVLQNATVWYKNPIAKMILFSARFTDAIIVISQNEKKLITSLLSLKSIFLKKVKLVYNGVPDTRDKYRQNTKNEVFTFCTASRLVDNKGIVEAIQSFKLLENRYGDLNACLKIYGTGSNKNIKKYKKLASTSKRISFEGHQVDAKAALATADVFLLPSYQEGFSIALLEASMLGKAIIASNVDSNPELIKNGETGILVAPKNEVELSTAMEQVYLSTSLKSKLEVNARDNYTRNYVLDDIVRNKILPLYSPHQKKYTAHQV